MLPVTLGQAPTVGAREGGANVHADHTPFAP